MAFDVFISYATKDIKTVDRLKDQLESSAIVDVFTAEYTIKPGESISRKIFNAINRCDFFILFWSKHSKESEWVSRELDRARKLDKDILPVILTPSLKPPGFLRDIKYLKAEEDIDAALEWLQSNVIQKAMEKKQRNRAIAFIIAWAILAILFKDE